MLRDLYVYIYLPALCHLNLDVTEECWRAGFFAVPAVFLLYTIMLICLNIVSRVLRAVLQLYRDVLMDISGIWQDINFKVCLFIFFCFGLSFFFG